MEPPIQVKVADERFTRFEAIEWWDQALLKRARILVIGAGAIGNEIIKNLALLGVGSIVVADLDRIEMSNLNRSVLYRAANQGEFKSECAARAAKEIYPELGIFPFVGNIMAELGLGFFRWADVVLGAVDNREARLFINSACARVGRTWFDGGIEVLNGIVRGFAATKTACYECLMSERDWHAINQRRSCSLLARRAEANHGAPTTPTTASVIGAIQAQETVKCLHGLECLEGSGFFFEGSSHSSYRIAFPISPECPWHESPASIESMPQWNHGTLLRDVWNAAGARLGGVDALDFSRELVQELECTKCNSISSVFAPVERITEEQALCESCGEARVPRFFHSVGSGSKLLDRSVREVGLPSWDIIWARHGDRSLGFELAGDNPIEKRMK